LANRFVFWYDFRTFYRLYGIATANIFVFSGIAAPNVLCGHASNYELVIMNYWNY
jgi:hypothetical protein